MTGVFAQQMQAISSSLANVSPIVGSVVADSWLGRYMTALIGSGLSIIGSSVMIAGAYTLIDWLFLVFFFLFYVAPVAVVKPNMIVFGADQFLERDPYQMKQREKFFSLNYWLQNIAGFLSFLIMSQIAIEGMGAITVEFAYTFVFILGTCSTVISFLCIIIGARKLWARAPQGSVLGEFGAITMDAFKDGKNSRGILTLFGLITLFVSVFVSIITYFIDCPPLNYILAGLICLCCIILAVWGGDSTWVLKANRDNPQDARFSPEQVSAVKDVYRLSPYIAYCIPFWAIYNQQYTGWTAQGCQMDNRIGSLEIAPSSMPAYNSLAIIIFIPICDLVILPFLAKFKGGKFAFTPLRRIGVGFFLGALALMAAAIIEFARRDAPIMMGECTLALKNKGECDVVGEQSALLSSCYSYSGDLASERVPKHAISIWWQLFAFCTIGLSEVLVAITYWDFFYSQVPPGIRSVCQAANFLTQALGTLVGAVINSICISWLPNNLDRGNQEYMLFINMGFILITWIFFVVLSPKFEYKPGTSGFPWDTIEEVVEDSSHKKSLSHKKSSSSSSSGDYYSYDSSSDHELIEAIAEAGGEAALADAIVAEAVAETLPR